MPSAIAVSIAGHGLSICASFRAAKMHAAISKTRFRPSFISEGYHIRFSFAYIYSTHSAKAGDETEKLPAKVRGKVLLPATFSRLSVPCPTVFETNI